MNAFDLDGRPESTVPAAPVRFATAARSFVAIGLAVHPCEPRGKKPVTPHGCIDATLDQSRIDAWGRRWPFANVGVACGPISGNLVVVDVDVSKGGDRTLAGLIRDRGPIPWTAEVTTGSGGSHFYFRSDAPITNSRDRIGTGIDVRAAGGFVIAPPSVHANGTRYSWVRNGVSTLAQLDGWLLEACLAAAAPAEPARAADFGRYGKRPDLEERLRRGIAYTEKRDPAISGAHGHDATWLVAQDLIRGFELPVEVSLEVLRHFNRRCSPPWTEKELRHKAESVAKQSKATPGYLLAGRP